jgi:hypothetical protein
MLQRTDDEIVALKRHLSPGLLLVIAKAKEAISLKATKTPKTINTGWDGEAAPEQEERWGQEAPQDEDECESKMPDGETTIDWQMWGMIWQPLLCLSPYPETYQTPSLDTRSWLQLSPAW